MHIGPRGLIYRDRTAVRDQVSYALVSAPPSEYFPRVYRLRGLLGLTSRCMAAYVVSHLAIVKKVTTLTRLRQGSHCTKTALSSRGRVGGEHSCVQV